MTLRVLRIASSYSIQNRNRKLTAQLEGHRQSLMPFLIALSNASHAMHQSKLTSYLIYVLFVARSASEFMCSEMLFFFPDKTEQIPYGFISTIHVYMKSILWMYPGWMLSVCAILSDIFFPISVLFFFLFFPLSPPLAARTECNKKLMNV